MLSLQVQKTEDINVDSKEFFAGPDADAWSKSHVGVMYFTDEVKREAVDVVKLSDIYGAGRRIVASASGTDVHHFPTDDFSWVRSRRDGTFTVVANSEISALSEREQLELLGR